MKKSVCVWALAALLSVSVFQISAIAHAHSDGRFQKLWRSDYVQGMLKDGEDFTLKVSANGSVFHRGGEVLLTISSFEKEERNCHKVALSGHGHIFREFKDELEDMMEQGRLLKSLLHRHSHLENLEAVICSRDESES